jgi:predicted GIY-YIG superfamily endonuclease
MRFNTSPLTGVSANIEEGGFSSVIPANAGIQAGGIEVGKQPAVYILASKRNGTLYVGVKTNLVKRVWEHKNDRVEGFTKKYGMHHFLKLALMPLTGEAGRGCEQGKIKSNPPHPPFNNGGHFHPLL